MSDCVYWAFVHHLDHLGIPVSRESHNMFRTLRMPTLPERRENILKSWYNSATKLVTPMVEGESAPPPGWEGAQPTVWDYSFTHGSVAPFIIRTMASYYGLGVRAEHLEMYGSETLRQLATNAIQQNIIDTNLDIFGKEVMSITLEPAIYLCLDGAISKHAQFSTRVPQKTTIAGAVQLYVPETKEHNYVYQETAFARD